MTINNIRMKKQINDFSHYFEQYSQLLEPIENKKSETKYQVFLSIDTEYVQETAKKNRCLSYQIASVMLDPNDGKIKTNNIIRFVVNDNRLEFKELVKIGVESLDINLDNLKLLIHVIAHLFTAEWSMLKDKKDPELLKKLTNVRKTPITTGKIIKTRFLKNPDVEIVIHDTMLIAPAASKSLEKLSNLLKEDDQKIHLTQKQKERMDLLLENDKQQFKTYALKDTEITLKLFFLIQETLHKIVGEEKYKIYNTLGSSAVKAFTNYLEDYQLKYKLESEFDHPMINPFFINKNKKSNKKKDNNKNKKTAKKKGKSQISKSAFKRLKGFREAESLVKSCYMGGKNESYFLGETFDNLNSPYHLKRTDIIKNKIYLDIDLQGAYPSAMSSIPLPDPAKIPLIENGDTKTYIDFKKLAKATAIDIETEILSVFDELKVARPKAAQLKTPFEVPQKLIGRIKMNLFKELAKYRIFFKTITIHQGVNNKLIDRWYRNRKKYETQNIPGFAKVRFKFPEETQFPSLPVSHVSYGLIYPLEGVSCCTAIEVVLAMEMIKEGNQQLEKKYRNSQETLKKKLGYIEGLQSVEFIPFKHENKPLLPLQEFFAKMLKKRKEYKALRDEPGREKEGEIMQTMVKEIVNSFYGKFAQAINYKKSFDIATGISKKLPKSLVTNPYFATLTTGLVRASLCAMLYSVEKRNRKQPEIMQYLPISCTTDGMLIGLPKPSNNTFKTENIIKEEDFQEILKELDQFEFYKELLEYLPNRQMLNGRVAMDEPEYLEVKHVVENVVNVKTRGQLGFIAANNKVKEAVQKIVPDLNPIWEYGITKVIARFGHKVPLSKIYSSDTYEYLMTPKENQLEDQIRIDAKNTADAYWLMKEYENEEDQIRLYPTSAPVSLKKMIQSDDDYDLVWNHSENKINTDFDWKRRIVKVDVKSNDQYTQWFDQRTEPFKDMQTFLKYRVKMDQLRKSRNQNIKVETGLKARPDLVYARMDMPPGRIRKNQVDLTARIFLSGLLQNQFDGFQKSRSYSIMAGDLNKIFIKRGVDVKFNINNFKNGKRTIWQDNTVTKNKTNDYIVGILCEYFNLKVEDVEQKLYKFALPEKDPMIIRAIEQAMRAIFNVNQLSTPKFEVFKVLKRVEGKSKDDLIQLILDNNRHSELNSSGLLQKGRLDNVLKGDFKNHQVPRNQTTRKYLTEFLKIFEDDLKKIERCLKMLFREDIVIFKSKNPALRSCLIQFVKAIYQKQIGGTSHIRPQYLLQKLERFGLHNALYYEERNQRFQSNSLKNTPKNRKTVLELLKALNITEHKDQTFSLLFE